jgi:hypothetical protein
MGKDRRRVKRNSANAAVEVKKYPFHLHERDKPVNIVQMKVGVKFYGKIPSSA